MPVYTANGLLASDVGDTGIYELATGEVLSAEPINKTWKDLQMPARYSLLPGVLEPPGLLDGITIDGLEITIWNLVWYAQGVYSVEEYVVSVPDDATTTIYARSDGSIGFDTDGFLASQFCVVCAVTAADGVGVIDYTVQQRARYADPDWRFCVDTGAYSAQPREIDSNAVVVIPEDFQMIFYPPSAGEPFECNGYLILNGRAKTEAW